MKQTEKLDLVLKSLYEEEDQSGEIVSLFKNKGHDVTLDDAHKLGRRLAEQGYVKFTPTKDSAYVDLTSQGIELVEEALF